MTTIFGTACSQHKILQLIINTLFHWSVFQKLVLNHGEEFSDIHESIAQKKKRLPVDTGISIITTLHAACGMHDYSLSVPNSMDVYKVYC